MGHRYVCLLFFARWKERFVEAGKKKSSWKQKSRSLADSSSLPEKSLFAFESRDERAPFPISPYQSRDRFEMERAGPRERGREITVKGESNGRLESPSDVGLFPLGGLLIPRRCPRSPQPLSSSSAFRTADRPWARDQTSAQIPRRPGG